MKKFFLPWTVTIVFAALCACSTNEPENVLQEEKQPIDMRTPDDCLIEENTALENVVNLLQLSDNNTSKRKVKSIRKVADENENGSNEGYYYLFNFEDNAGFAIASADTRDSIDVFVASPEGNLPSEAWSDSGEYAFLKNLVDNYHYEMVAKAQGKS